MTGRSLEEIEKCDEKQAYDDPEGQILAEIVHGEGLSCRAGQHADLASWRQAVAQTPPL
jgi:hypothetical protein